MKEIFESCSPQGGCGKLKNMSEILDNKSLDKEETHYIEFKAVNNLEITQIHENNVLTDIKLIENNRVHKNALIKAVNLYKDIALAINGNFEQTVLLYENRIGNLGNLDNIYIKEDVLYAKKIQFNPFSSFSKNIWPNLINVKKISTSHYAYVTSINGMISEIISIKSNAIFIEV